MTFRIEQPSAHPPRDFIGLYDGWATLPANVKEFAWPQSHQNKDQLGNRCSTKNTADYSSFSNVRGNQDPNVNTNAIFFNVCKLLISDIAMSR